MSAVLSFLLLPFSWLFGFIVKLRRYLYERSGNRFTAPVPAIVIGNLSTGGTGKTPHAALVSELLAQHGKKVAWLSRGYGRKSSGFKKVETDSAASDVGDEPLMLKKRFPEMPVFVCENRVEGIQKLTRDEPTTEFIVLDDAYQHLRLKPHLSLVLLTYDSLNKPWRLLPAGQAREPLSAIKYAQAVIITKCPDEIHPDEKAALSARIKKWAGIPVFFSRYTYLEPIDGKGNKLDNTKQKSALLICGIANPEPLIKWLNPQFAVLKKKCYPDHHYFTRTELETNIHEAGTDYIFTTEKDRVRMLEIWPELAHNPAFITIQVVPELDGGLRPFESFLFAALSGR